MELLGTFLGIVMGITLMLMGLISGGSTLREPINTASIVFLFGLLLLVIGLK